MIQVRNTHLSRGGGGLFLETLFVVSEKWAEVSVLLPEFLDF